jgi:D-alanine-D-alanine ligase
MWEATGLPYADLIDELVRLALDRHERRRRFSTKR